MLMLTAHCLLGLAAYNCVDFTHTNRHLADQVRFLELLEFARHMAATPSAVTSPYVAAVSGLFCWYTGVKVAT